MSAGSASSLGSRGLDVGADPFMVGAKGEGAIGTDAFLAQQLTGQTATAPWSAPYSTMSPWSILLTGVYMPCYMFILILTSFTFLYHRLPAAPWLAALLCLDIVVVATWPPAHRWNGRGRWDWLPLLNGTLAVGFAVVLGLLNYSNMEMWVHTRHLQSYNGVSPDVNPKTMSDAGVVHFAAGTALDIASSAGYRAWPYTYCAAPVVGSAAANGTATGAAAGTAATAAATGTATAAATGTATAGTAAATTGAAAATAGAASPQLVGFWAVGVNCCNAQGDFWCDGADDSQAHAGLRLESHWAGRTAGHDAGEYFAKAVKKAAAAQGLAVADSPVFLLWTRSPDNVALRSWWIGICVYAVFVLLALGSSYGCRMLWQSFVVKAQHICK